MKVIWGYEGNVFGPVSGGTLILLHSPDGGLDGYANEGGVELKKHDNQTLSCLPANDIE